MTGGLFVGLVKRGERVGRVMPEYSMPILGRDRKNRTKFFFGE